MSALARYYKHIWYEVFWSDKDKTNEILLELEKEWIKVFYSHSEKNISWDEEKVFYTEAIPESNLELKKAKELWIKTLSYFQWIWEISKQKKCIWITGTHGKTTTTAMVWIILKESWFDPLVIVWSKVPNFDNKNISFGKWEYFVLESCEYRESFLNIDFFIAWITNIELDHIDYYKNELNYKNAFKKMTKNISKDWFLFYNREDKNSLELAESLDIQKIWVWNDFFPKLKIPWNHIIFDANLAIAICEKIGIPKQKSIKILEEKFIWTWRRFETIANFWDLVFISDYWHHPTEIRATLLSARQNFANKKIICIFEPHQYSRTIWLIDEFSECFFDCDLMIIPSIYKVRDNEEDIKNMSPEIFSNFVNKKSNNSISLSWYEELSFYLEKNLKWNELVIFMWAWDIDNFARKFVSRY